MAMLTIFNTNNLQQQRQTRISSLRSHHKTRSMSFLSLICVSVCPLLFLLLQVSGELTQAAAPIQVGGFMDESATQFCYDALNTADTSNDGRLDLEEYVTFAQLLSFPGLLDTVQSFDDLPLEFQTAFLVITCLCQDETFGGDPNDTTCCNDLSTSYIKIPPTPPDQDPPIPDRAYLYATCTYTRSAATAVVGSPSPISVPVPATAPPSLAPSTVAPTPSPTTESPTALPTGPTLAPTSSPTSSPTITGRPTTLSPTTSPSAAPSPDLGPRMDASLGYTVKVSQGSTLTSTELAGHVSDLQIAMNRLAVRLQSSTSGQRQVRRNLQRQAAQVTVILPTTLGSMSETECPPSSSDENDLCQNIESIVPVRILSEDPSTLDSDLYEFERSLVQATRRGWLQDELNILTNSTTPITILDVQDPTPPVGVPGGPNTKAVPDNQLSPGAIVGIVLASLFVVIVTGYCYLRSRRKTKDEPLKGDEEIKKNGTPSQDDEEDSFDVSPQKGRGPDAFQEPDVYIDSSAKIPPATVTIGATEADYGRSSQNAPISKSRGGAAPAAAAATRSQASAGSSSAGRSGWSSSQGVTSSQNTGSSGGVLLAGAGAAAVGATAMLQRKPTEDSGSDVMSSSQQASKASINELESQIEAGDWAAVGATAALLAAASDSQSGASRSMASKSRETRDATSVDAARAAELDHLVDTGDWDGLIAAAARYEAATAISSKDSDLGSRGSFTSSAASGSGTGTGTGTGTVGSPSRDTTISESQSRVHRLDEIRSEVEALVRRVVPEEIDNVDEMMNQFKGREEELVETLRTMQERSVAQKARTAGQRAAKVEARKAVQRGGKPALSPNSRGSVPQSPAVKNAVSIGVGEAMVSAVPHSPDKEVNISLSNSFGTDESIEQQRTALENAINSGDWQAVGEAAAMLSDGSVGTMSTGEINRYTTAQLSTSSFGSSPSKNRSLSGLEAARAAEIDAMVQRGDWNGVMAATKRFEADSGDGQSPKGPSKEEEEALKQAELWMEIAKQKKAEGATDAAASNAAEWAIQRSLSKMKNAEKGSPTAEGNEEV